MPPPPLSNEQFCHEKIWSKQDFSLDTPFSVRDKILKQRFHIPRHKLPSPFKAQCDGGLESAFFRVEALVVVPLYAEKLNMLPRLGALLILGTDRNGGNACISPPS